MDGVFKLATWNLGGGKLLRIDPQERGAAQDELNKSLSDLASKHDVDIIMLQELGVVEGPNGPAECLVKAPDGYHLKWALSLDSKCQTYPDNWELFRKQGGWDKETHIGLGLGFMWKKSLSHSPLWEEISDTSKKIQFEEVRFDTGLYTGRRDSEPRLALVARFLPEINGKVFDLMIVNLHLTTLRDEREGIPRIDNLGSQIRRQQIRVILDGIVSRYNTWRAGKKSSEPTTESTVSTEPAEATTATKATKPKRSYAIWILAGDFNCVPTSYEVEELKHMNFVDLNPDKGMGTKSSGLGKQATITLDYIFAGPRYVAVTEYVLDYAQKSSPKPDNTAKGSDHYPVVAELEIGASRER